MAGGGAEAARESRPGMEDDGPGGSGPESRPGRAAAAADATPGEAQGRGHSRRGTPRPSTAPPYHSRRGTRPPLDSPVHSRRGTPLKMMTIVPFAGRDSRR